MNIQDMMRQAQEAQQRLQQQMTEMRAQATAGGGMVTVTVNGHKHLLSLAIDPEVVSKDDLGMLQDLIVAAVNDAHRKVDEELKRSIGGLSTAPVQWLSSSPTPPVRASASSRLSRACPPIPSSATCSLTSEANAADANCRSASSGATRISR